AEANLAYDLSNGPHRGRLYLVYLNAASPTTDDTDVFVRFSDNNGANFSAPIRVNDVTTGSQFLPSIVVDRLTGNVAVGWLDSRNESTSVHAAQYFLTASINGGLSYLPNVRISIGPSPYDSSAARTGRGYSICSGLLS